MEYSAPNAVSMSYSFQGLGIVMEEVTERLEKLERIDDFKERVESGQNRTVASMNSQ